MRWPSSCIGHVPCENCGSRDNKAIYDDGHGFCFGCNKYYPPERKRMNVVNSRQTHFPTDLSSEIPSRFKNWLEGKGLTPSEISTHYVYSQELDRVVHVTKSQNGPFAEARSTYSYSHPKVLQFGHKPYRIYGNLDDSGILVIVEDLISAIKVGRFYGTIPLFGANLPTEIMSLVSRNCDVETIVVWLDADKFTMSSYYAKKISSLGTKAAALYSNYDPKHYTSTEIQEMVGEVVSSLESVGQQEEARTGALPISGDQAPAGSLQTEAGKQTITEGLTE